MRWAWPLLLLASLLAAGLAGLDQVLLVPVRSAAPWWRWVSAVGDGEVRLGATVAACAGLWWLRGRLEAVLMAGTGLVATALSWAIKAGVGRQRPPDALVDVASGSFPSGHALGSTATYLTAAILAAPGDRGAVAAAAGVAALVGMSRMALGVHYLSDVAAGWLLGLLLVMAAHHLRSRIRAKQDGERRRGDRPPGPAPPAAP